MGFLQDLFDPSGWGHDVGNDRLAQVGDPFGISPGNPGVGMKGETPTNESAEALAEISRALFEQTQPIRTGLIDRSNAFLSGNMDVTQSPMFASLHSSVDRQFKKARDNTIGRTAAGGGLTDALANIEMGRASSMVAGEGEIAQGEIDRAFGLATGILPTATGGLGQSAAIQAQQIAAAQAQQAQAKQGAGVGAGMIVASMVS